MNLLARYFSAFAGLPRAAWLLATVLLVNTSGTMVAFFMTLYLTRTLGWPAAQAGLAMSGYGVGMLAGTLTGGLLADRLGPFRVQRLSLTGSGLILVALSFLHEFPVVLAAIIAWGFFASALWPANAAAMAAVCPPAVRTRGFVLNRLAANLGATVGPLLGGFLAQHDYRLLFWVDGGTCLLAALAAKRFFPGSRPDTAAPVTGRPEAGSGEPWWQDHLFVGVLLVAFGVALAFSQLLGTYGIYLKAVAGLSESRIGALVAVNTVLIVLVQMPLTHGTDRFSRTRLAAFGALLLGAGFALTPFGNSWPYLAATVVVWTFGEMLTLPLLTTLVSLRASADAQGRYQGMFSMSYALGITLGPALGTWVYTAFGGRILWAAVGGVGVTAAGGMLALSRHWDGRTEHLHASRETQTRQQAG